VSLRWHDATRDERKRVPRLRRPPVTAASPAVAAVSGWLYVATGLLVIASTYVPSAVPDRQLAVVRAVNVIALGAGALVLLRRDVKRPWLPQLAPPGGVLLITTALLGSGGGVSAVAYAAVYCLAPAYAYLILPRRSASATMVFTVVIGGPALAMQPGVGVAEQVIIWGVTLILGAVVGWLARALEEAESDSLTGLANRRGVERALQAAISATGESGRLAFAVLDVDHFKALNDDQGRAAGDRLLVQIAATWAPLVPPGATLGRMAADEFGLVLPGTSADRASALVTSLQEALAVGATCSAGVAAREPSESASMLVARTDSALYTAKRDGRARTHQHPGTDRDGSAVREALARGEFVVHYQPIVELSSGAVVAAEALVRWQHPDGDLVPPVEFLTDAERSGAIVDLGRWVLGEACREAAGWTPVDGVLPYVTVNASGRELQGQAYAATVAAALAASGLPAERLVLELVESHYDIESTYLAGNLHKLRAMGVRTAMDDFGVGYSSLHRLGRAGVDILKIDRSFTADITAADQEAPLVAAIIAMARALGLRVVAEGVETQAQARWLTDHGCECAQGWLFGRPAPRLRPARHEPSATAR